MLRKSKLIGVLVPRNIFVPTAYHTNPREKMKYNSKDRKRSSYTPEKDRERLNVSSLASQFGNCYIKTSGHTFLVSKRFFEQEEPVFEEDLGDWALRTLTSMEEAIRTPVIYFQILVDGTRLCKLVPSLAITQLALRQDQFNVAFALQAIRFLLSIVNCKNNQEQVIEVCHSMLDHVTGVECPLPIDVQNSVKCATMALMGRMEESCAILQSNNIRMQNICASLLAAQSFKNNNPQFSQEIRDTYFGKADSESAPRIQELSSRAALMVVYEGCIEYLKRLLLQDSNNIHQIVSQLDKLCQELVIRKLNPTPNVVEALETLVGRINYTAKSTVLTVNTFKLDTLKNKSICPCCKNEMRTDMLTEEEAEELKKEVYEKVLTPKGNMHSRSVPGELTSFFRFLESAGPFKVVVDGLNVLFLSNSNFQNMGKENELTKARIMLEKLCFLFKCEPKDILITARKHVATSNARGNVYQLLKNMGAVIFLLNDVSHDDCFLLYAALSSGPRTWVVSRDRFADHSSSLSPYHSFLYHKFACSRQTYVTKYVNLEPFFKVPPSVLPLPQYFNNTYHMPISDARYQFFYALPFNWLCITKKLIDAKKLNIEIENKNEQTEKNKALLN